MTGEQVLLNALTRLFAADKAEDDAFAGEDPKAIAPAAEEREAALNHANRVLKVFNGVS